MSDCVGPVEAHPCTQGNARVSPWTVPSVASLGSPQGEGSSPWPLGPVLCQAVAVAAQDARSGSALWLRCCALAALLRSGWALALWLGCGSSCLVFTPLTFPLS